MSSITNIDNLIERLSSSLEMLRDKKPLIEQVTNYVTINDCANVTLAIGASPVMADAYDEVDQMTSISDALVLNFGIVSESSLKTMIKAGKSANLNNIGVVFDPVGVGATEFRNKSAEVLLNSIDVSIIKGNASEIMSLAGCIETTRGVDSSIESIKAVDSAIFLANKYNCVCAVTGEVDLVTDGKILVKIFNGSEKLSLITGTGCMIASLIGSFLGATKKPLISAISGILAMSISGELAEFGGGIGSYRENLMNNLSNFSPETIREFSKLEILNIESKYSMYLVTDESACGKKDFYESVEDSILGGSKIVQLREKNMDTRDFLERANRLKDICNKHGVSFLINDRIDIALACGCDGVHLGQGDMPIDIARKLLGVNKIIGISAGSLDEAIEAEKMGADYIGVGAIFSTSTKSDSEVISKKELIEIVNSVDIPVLAIGGIKSDNLSYLKNVGVDGICVISEILGSDDCEEKTKSLVDGFRNIRDF